MRGRCSTVPGRRGSGPRPHTHTHTQASGAEGALSPRGLSGAPGSCSCLPGTCVSHPGPRVPVTCIHSGKACWGNVAHSERTPSWQPVLQPSRPPSWTASQGPRAYHARKCPPNAGGEQLLTTYYQGLSVPGHTLFKGSNQTEWLQGSWGERGLWEACRRRECG